MQKHITIIATEFGVENHGLENRTAVYEFLVDSAMTSDDFQQHFRTEFPNMTALTDYLYQHK